MNTDTFGDGIRITLQLIRCLVRPVIRAGLSYFNFDKHSAVGILVRCADAL